MSSLDRLRANIKTLFVYIRRSLIAQISQDRSSEIDQKWGDNVKTSENHIFSRMKLTQDPWRRFFKESMTWSVVHFDGKLLGVFQRVFDIIWDICGARPALCFITGFCRVTSVFKLNIWFEQSHHCCCKTNLIFSQYAIFQFYLWLPIVGYISLWLYLAMWVVCYWCWYFWWVLWACL